MVQNNLKIKQQVSKKQNIMSTNSTFYPSIGTLVSADSIPEALSFVSPRIQNVLNSVFYRSRQVVEGEDGAQSSCKLDFDR